MSDLIQTEEQLFEVLMSELREALRLGYPRHLADAGCKRALDNYVDRRIEAALSDERRAS